MLALTVRQPFASLIMLGLKTWETRDWKPPLEMGQQTLTIAIHAAKTISPREKSVAYHHNVRPTLKEHFQCLNDLPRGVVLGTVEVSWFVPCKLLDLETISPLNRLVGWWDSEYAWKLEQPAPWSSPIHAQGQQGLWEFNP